MQLFICDGGVGYLERGRDEEKLYLSGCKYVLDK